MDNIWDILEIEPSTDTSVIKKAYARQTHKYHPEENPEMFLRLREAYQAAIVYSDSQQAGASEIEDRTGCEMCTVTHSMQPENQLEEAEGWQLIMEKSEENPYLQHEAYRQFLNLYTGSQRKNSKVWMEYVTSPAFLEVYRERAFAQLLLEEVERQEVSPSREFLTWLHIAYLFTSMTVWDWEVREFQPEQGAEFDGIELLYQIAEKGPIPKRFMGNELAMFFSFSEYRHLMSLAERGIWDEKSLTDARQILGYYVLAYLQEKCVKKEWSGVERHPAGIRLLNDFFARQTLPEELYRILWDQLSLKTATMGRTKILYGRLREIVLERVPGIEAEEESFTKLYQEDIQYFSACTGGADPQKDLEKTNAFFAREDLQRALRNRRFVEEYVLRIWLSRKDYMHNDYIPDLFIERLITFYHEHPDAPCAARVIWQAEQTLLDRKVERHKEEDRLAPVRIEHVDVSSRPFFRHWLNTGFYLAKDPSNGEQLCSYLARSLPFLEDWSRRFGQEANRWETELDGRTITIFFHQWYIEYRVDSKLVRCPLLNWQALTEKLGDENNSLFLLLPVTAAPYDQYGEVRDELFHRLRDTAAPEEDRAVIAGFLAGHVCCLPISEERSKTRELYIHREELPASIPLEMFAENQEHLYGCSWFPQSGVLLFFEQTAADRSDLPRNCYQNIYKETHAFLMAKRILKEIAAPSAYNLSLLQTLPSVVYVQSLHASAETVKGGITLNRLSGWMDQFAHDGLKRLQFQWPEGSLVFVRDENGYACFYFDDIIKKYFTLLSLPEVYETVPHSEVQYVPFGLGKLPNYAVHHDTASIICRLDNVFSQIGRGVNPLCRVGKGKYCLWDIGCIGTNQVHCYRMARQKLGGYPAEQVQNYILAKFVISRYPDQLEKADMENGSQILEIRSEMTEEVRLDLIEFMQKKLGRLRLTWKAESEGQPWYPLHIILLQDAGRYMMAYLRDDRQQAQYYVADPQTYMDVKGENYLKETFMGRTVPAYLIHKDAGNIRNCLDLIFDDMADLPVVFSQFAAFADESPVNPRTYEEVRAELVGTDC